METISSEDVLIRGSLPSNNILLVDDEVGSAIYRPKEMPLDRIRLDRLTSSYVESGFRQDQISIIEAHFYENGAHLMFNVDDYFMPSDGEFHLSSLVADQCIMHTGVMYSHVDTGSTVRDREIYVRSSQLVFRKPIRSTTFPLDIEITKKAVKKSNIFYQAKVDFNEGCFTGKFNWVIPAK